MAIFNLDTHPEKWITVADLAAYWNVSMRTIERLIVQGDLVVGRVKNGQREVRTTDARKLQRPVGA